MTAPPTDPPVPAVPIPDAEQVRQRLAALLTEADVLRRQLRVSACAERERERIRKPLTPKEAATVAH